MTNRMNEVAKVLWLMGGLLFFGISQAANPVYWDAKKLADFPAPYVKLLDSEKQVVATLPTSQLRALMDVKSRLESIAGIDTTLLIRGDQQVNAFATYAEGKNVVMITLGMLKITGGNSEELAMLVGHEIGHLVRNHAQESTSRDSIINLIGAIVGVVLEAKLQRKYNIQGLGLNLSDLGAQAVSTTFSRDQEREADALGVEWMISAGFDPAGGVRLWTKMFNRSGDSSFVFLSTHPNPSERIENVRRIAQENAGRVAQLVASAKPTPAVVTTSPTQHTASLTAEISESTANSSYRRGMAAFQKKDFQGAMKEWSSGPGQQDPRALYGIAVLYQRGLGVPRNYTDAMKWFQRAADDKFAPALTAMGSMYQLAWGVPRDMKKAVSLLEEAALLSNQDG